MKPSLLKWPAVYANGEVVLFEPAMQPQSAYVGGPLNQSFSGVEFGPAPLHRVFSFQAEALSLPSESAVRGEIALFYGMQFDGCLLTYRRWANPAQRPEGADSGVEIIQLAPNKASDQWPYPNYPGHLPQVFMREKKRIRITPEEFSRQYSWVESGTSATPKSSQSCRHC